MKNVSTSDCRVGLGNLMTGAGGEVVPGRYGEGVGNQAQMPQGPRLWDWVQAQGCSLEEPMRVGKTQLRGAGLRLEL